MYNSKVEVERRNTEQLTKQIDVMKSKILEQVGSRLDLWRAFVLD